MSRKWHGILIEPYNLGTTTAKSPDGAGRSRFPLDDMVVRLPQNWRRLEDLAKGYVPPVSTFPRAKANAAYLVSKIGR